FRYAVDGIGEDTTVGAETLIASRYPVDGWGRTPRSAPRRSAAGPFSVPVSTANASTAQVIAAATAATPAARRVPLLRSSSAARSSLFQRAANPSLREPGRSRSTT